MLSAGLTRRPADGKQQQPCGEAAAPSAGASFPSGGNQSPAIPNGSCESEPPKRPAARFRMWRSMPEHPWAECARAVRSGRYRGEAFLSTFAHSVAHFTCVEHARRHRLDPAAGPEASLLQAERARLRMRALSRLPSGAREWDGAGSARRPMQIGGSGRLTPS